MNRTKVKSSLIREIAYDPHEQIMEISFVSGRIYRYYGINSLVYAALLGAESKGSYFNRFIRPKFKAKEVNYA